MVFFGKAYGDKMFSIFFKSYGVSIVTETTEGMFSKGYYLNHVNIIKSRLLQRSGKLLKL